MPDLAAILLLAARVLHVYRERPITASITTMAILPNYDGSGAGVTWQRPIITHYYPSNQVVCSNLLFSNQIHNFQQLHWIV